MKKEMIKFRSLALVITALLGWGIYYITLPALNFRSAGMWVYISVMLCILTFSFWVVDYFVDGELALTSKVSLIVTAVIIVGVIIAGIAGSPVFHAKAYRQLVDIEESTFTKDVKEINENDNIAIVDVKTAKHVGDRTLGNLKNSSWYEVDSEYNLILYKGKQYRISALKYGDPFKWYKAKNIGIPGYICVDSANQESTLVEVESPIMYSPSALFSKNLTRTLRRQYPKYIFGKSFFEIDENGVPYYITSVKTPNIVFGAKKEESFIITNASTGESKEYKTEELPEWVDHAFDLEYLMKVVYYNFEYIHGSVFNWSNTDVKRTSYKYNINYYNTEISNDGVNFYTGVTPANRSESNMGFILANTRTGKIKYYTCSGAEESSAQDKVEGLVQNYNYEASFPTVLNIDGQETYFMVLKDGSGTIQKYAFCNIKDYTLAVEADSLEEALEKYRKKIGKEVIEPEIIEKVKGKISNLYQAEIGGYTYYYFELENNKNLYMSSIQNNNKQVKLVIGTEVEIECVMSKTEDGVYTVKSIKF